MISSVRARSKLRTLDDENGPQPTKKVDGRQAENLHWRGMDSKLSPAMEETAKSIDQKPLPRTPEVYHRRKRASAATAGSQHSTDRYVRLFSMTQQAKDGRNAGCARGRKRGRGTVSGRFFGMTRDSRSEVISRPRLFATLGKRAGDNQQHSLSTRYDMIAERTNLLLSLERLDR
jgi:hypothetical protein